MGLGLGVDISSNGLILWRGKGYTPRAIRMNIKGKELRKKDFVRI
jgi:hypothetical protein